MKIALKKIKAGDFVYCTGDSSFCDPSTEKVVKVTVQYDTKNGSAYNIIHLSGGRKFDSRDGYAINSPLAYYLVPTEQESAKAEQEKEDKEETERKKQYRQREKEKKAVLAKLTPKERKILGF